MGKLFLGSIDLSKINKDDIVSVDKNGKPFENGAKYLNISIFENEQADKFGNHISIKSGKKESSYYIGNGKKYESKEQKIESKNIDWL